MTKDQQRKTECLVLASLLQIIKTEQPQLIKTLTQGRIPNKRERLYKQASKPARCGIDLLKKRKPANILDFGATILPKSSIMFQRLGLSHEQITRVVSEEFASIDDLQQAIQDGTYGDAEIAQRVLVAKPKRVPRPIALHVARFLKNQLSKIDTKFVATGALRRGCPFVDQVEVLLTAKYNVAWRERLLKELNACGSISVVEPSQINLYVRYQGQLVPCRVHIFDHHSYATALAFSTGPSDHVVALKTRAHKHNLLLNKYGLWHNGITVPITHETQLYQFFGLPWHPPEIRQNGLYSEIVLTSAPRLVFANTVSQARRVMAQHDCYKKLIVCGTVDDKFRRNLVSWINVIHHNLSTPAITGNWIPPFYQGLVLVTQPAQLKLKNPKLVDLRGEHARPVDGCLVVASGNPGVLDSSDVTQQTQRHHIVLSAGSTRWSAKRARRFWKK